MAVQTIPRFAMTVQECAALATAYGNALDSAKRQPEATGTLVYLANAAEARALAVAGGCNPQDLATKLLPDVFSGAVTPGR